ncbi:MAG: hypothetical protein AAFQ42_09210 [Pseudomonadota bacterium]
MTTNNPSTRSVLARLGTAVALCIAAITLSDTRSDAGMLDKLLRGAGDLAESGAKRGPLADADLPTSLTRSFAALPEPERARTLIATTTPEGHVRLTNADGTAVTAGAESEIGAALTYLLPQASEKARGAVAIHMQAGDAFAHREALALLPEDARITLVGEDGNTHRLIERPARPRSVDAAAEPLRLRLGDRLIVAAHTPKDLREVAWQARRAFNPANIRLLSFDDDAARRLPSVRVGDGRLPVEPVNPFGLVDDMRSLRGQTVVISGEITDDLLAFTARGSARQTVSLTDLRTAARRDDVNLVVLAADTPRQPGTRNLVWQRAALDGIDEATAAASLGDFWSALAGPRGALELSIDRSAVGDTRQNHHVRLTARTVNDAPLSVTDEGGSFLQLTERFVTELVSTAAGEIVTRGIDATMRSEAYDRELARRLVPGIPSDIQIIYLLAGIAGLIGLPTVTRWWRRLWPLAPSPTFASTLGYLANRLLRAVLFWPLFLPLAGIFAGPYQLIARPFEVLTLPFVLLWRRLRPA